MYPGLKAPETLHALKNAKVASLGEKAIEKRDMNDHNNISIEEKTTIGNDKFAQYSQTKRKL